MIGTPRLRADRICFSYRDREIIRNVDLSVDPEEILGVLGPNGAGKSTLLSILAGTLSPTSGVVELDGRDLRSLSPRKRARRIAALRQTPTVPPGMTVEQIVTMGRHPHLGFLGSERREDRQASRTAMEMVDVLHLGQRTLDTLSGGERSRALLARALAQEPDLLLLDEPTAHLDVARRSEMLRLVRQIRAQTGLSVIAAIHDLTLAARHCDRLALLHEGMIRTCGPPDHVLTPTFLRELFGVNALILPHPADGSPLVIWD